MTDEQAAIVSAHLGTEEWVIAPRLTLSLAMGGVLATVTREQIKRIVNKELYIHRWQRHTHPAAKPGDAA